MALPNLNEAALLDSISDQLAEVEADLSLVKHRTVNLCRPEIQQIVRYLQIAHFTIGYERLVNAMKARGYTIHRLGIDGADAVVSGYSGAIDTAKGKIIF